MRCEKEMMDLIVGIAKDDERIRGVYLNGSRTNSNAPRDIFQDYDIVYVVTETTSFIDNEDWIDVFGERLYMQLPEKNDKLLGQETDLENCYGYLMQLADGNRIDLHLMTLQYAIEDILHDRLCIILLDKDGDLPKIPKATDEDHWVKKPSQEEFAGCCNEFWWLLNNIGKGLYRGEIPYVMDMLNIYSRPQLITMLSWYVGIHTDFSCSVGKSGKYLYKYLSESKGQRLLRTYPTGNLENIWQSVFVMCDLFDEIARKAARRLNYSYDYQEAHNSRLFLDCTYELPGDAKQILMVRRMREQDVDKVAEIWLEGNINTHDFIPEEYWRENYEAVRNQLAETEVYIYEDNRGILGFVGIDKGYIRGIFVRPEMRGQGIGKALMTICKSKYFKIHLHVYCKNTSAVNFYMQSGFKISKKQLDEKTKHSEYEMIWRKE